VKIQAQWVVTAGKQTDMLKLYCKAVIEICRIEFYSIQTPRDNKTSSKKWSDKSCILPLCLLHKVLLSKQ